MLVLLTAFPSLSCSAQPTITAALLFMLPVGLRWLELGGPQYTEPLLPNLARFSRLEELIFSGNSADVCWDVGPAAALAPLRALCLDYRQQPEYPNHPDCDSEVERLPSSTQRALCAATALHSLELCLYWSDEVAQLCLALPGLRHLT